MNENIRSMTSDEVQAFADLKEMLQHRIDGAKRGEVVERSFMDIMFAVLNTDKTV